MTLASRALSVCTVAALAVGGAVLLPSSASAAGVGDVSGAVLYGTDGPIGAVLEDLANEDDDETTVELPFDVNFFGVESAALCVNTNGVVAPVPTLSDGCGSDYDVDLENYALRDDVSVIGALLADNDPGERLWLDEGVAVVGFSLTGGVGTFTTAEAHGFQVNDIVDVDVSDEWDRYDVIGTPTTTTFEVAIPAADIPFTAIDGRAGINYSSFIHDTDSDGFADDGFGNVSQIYAGATTVDGKDAFAVTWYRVPTNDVVNAPWLSNTYQIVLVQEPTGGANGSDFTVQFNFGTLTDANDGYRAGDGATDCDSDEPEDCRWAVGLVRYDEATETAEAFEFFADYAITEIVDGGATPLVHNSLNSGVLGRYILGMVDGTVAGFEVPTLVAPGAAQPPTGPTLAATGSSSPTVLVPVAGLVLLLGAGLLIARRRTA